MQGYFDETAISLGWFDETAQPAGWFDEDLLNTASSGVNYTLTGDAGSYALTGRAASFKVNRFLAGAAGSYTLTGVAATFKVNRFLSGSAGSYALTGNSATLNYVPGAGTQNYTLTGEAGSYTLTGQNATFAYSGEVVEEPVYMGPGFKWAEEEIKPKEDFSAYIKQAVEKIIADVKQEIPAQDVKPVVKQIRQEFKPVVDEQALQAAIERTEQLIADYMNELDEEEALIYLL